MSDHRVQQGPQPEEHLHGPAACTGDEHMHGLLQSTLSWQARTIMAAFSSSATLRPPEPQSVEVSDDEHSPVHRRCVRTPWPPRESHADC